MNKVWIDLQDLPLPLYRQASDLVQSLGIQTDYWGRCRAEISDEALAALRTFEDEHSDGESGSDGYGVPFACCIVAEMSDAAYEQAHETPVQIGKYTEYSWQH